MTTREDDKTLINGLIIAAESLNDEGMSLTAARVYKAIKRLTELTQGDVVVVPKVPTKNMVRATEKKVFCTAKEVYTAMINAAQEERG